ncbi:MAG: hypothetical protein CVU14_00770 [Bacteroidetes bacterium HGW-Bacteroidetes-9]|jgi:hypothetical protein|nr:MAG: hypothetical protein CVU14_00770 [Bacteroidetes bacterium HGW-Bacteroidetes-9]
MLSDKNTKSGPAKLLNFAKTESLASESGGNENFIYCWNTSSYNKLISTFHFELLAFYFDLLL